MKTPFLPVSSLILAILCAISCLSSAWALPVVGRTDTFENGTTQGWGGSYSVLTPLPSNITTGGPAGPNDSYLEIRTNGFHLATKNESRAWTGDYLSVGVKAISMDLKRLEGNTDIFLRLALFGPGGMFATKARTRPLNDRGGWVRHTFELGMQDLIHVADGTGVREDTLGNVTKILIRHDWVNPGPPGSHPPHVTAAVGIDNIHAVLREYDVAWIFGNKGTEAYLLEEIEPSHINLGELNATNPTLSLRIGQRYQVTVDFAEAFPLEIIAKGSNEEEDRVLLSMKNGIDGPFEQDEQVDWYDPGNGTAVFTLTPDLWSALQGEDHQQPGYRAGFFSQTMRGDFVVVD